MLKKDLSETNQFISNPLILNFFRGKNFPLLLFFFSPQKPAIQKNSLKTGPVIVFVKFRAREIPTVNKKSP